MKYEEKTKEQRIDESADLHQHIEDLEARETNRRQAEFVGNVYLFEHRRSIFIWENNKCAKG